MSQIDWVELVLGFACNCRCVICPSAYLEPSAPMSASDITRALTNARRRGAAGVWFGGGEPTLHPRLPQAVAEARSLGFQRIRIQTNAMRLSYPDYTAALAAAGATEVALSVMGATAADHDAVTQTARSFELMLAGGTRAKAAGMRLEADVLVTSRSVGQLGDVVRVLADAGVESFTFWLASLHGLDAERLADWVPSLPVAGSAVADAIEIARSLRVTATTLHTPPCVLPSKTRKAYVHSGTWRLEVVVPGGEPFMAETSPMEGGVFVGACAACSARGDCLGLRADYLAVHGEADIAAL